MPNIAFGGAEHHLRAFAVRHLPERGEEFVTVHPGHVPIEQNRIRHATAAGIERHRAVFCFDDIKLHIFEDSPRDFANDT